MFKRPQKDHKIPRFVGPPGVSVWRAPRYWTAEQGRPVADDGTSAKPGIAELRPL